MTYALVAFTLIVAALIFIIIRARRNKSAIDVTVTGKVAAPDGTGIGKMVVTMVDGDGFVLSATTGAFGFFAFEQVIRGEDYTFSVKSRRYNFEDRTVFIAAETVLEDFIGVPK